MKNTELTMFEYWSENLNMTAEEIEQVKASGFSDEEINQLRKPCFRLKEGVVDDFIMLGCLMEIVERIYKGDKEGLRELVQSREVHSFYIDKTNLPNPLFAKCGIEIN